MLHARIIQIKPLHQSSQGFTEIDGKAVVFLFKFAVTVYELNPVLYEIFSWEVGSKEPGRWHFTDL